MGSPSGNRGPWWTISGVGRGSGSGSGSGAGAGAGGGVAGIAVHTAAWLAGEKWFMAGRGLAFGPRAALAALLREVLAPALMIAALGRRAIYWRGTDLGGHWSSRRDDAAGKLV